LKYLGELRKLIAEGSTLQRTRNTSVFFFSSRRRHTRWPRDWSSDVCSSDLPARPCWTKYSTQVSHFVQQGLAGALGLPHHKVRRSEERRVGKEGRCRCSRRDKKKKKHVARRWCW